MRSALLMVIAATAALTVTFLTVGAAHAQPQVGMPCPSDQSCPSVYVEAKTFLQFRVGRQTIWVLAGDVGTLVGTSRGALIVLWQGVRDADTGLPVPSAMQLGVSPRDVQRLQTGLLPACGGANPPWPCQPVPCDPRMGPCMRPMSPNEH